MKCLSRGLVVSSLATFGTGPLRELGSRFIILFQPNVRDGHT